MTFPGSGGPNFFEQLLGDLMKVMGGAASAGGRVEFARTWAQQLASGNEPEANVEPAERIAFEQLAPVAELHVTELTGLPVTPSGASVEVTAVSPGLWAWHTVDDWRFLLDAMSTTPRSDSGPGTGARRPDAPETSTGGTQDTVGDGTELADPDREPGALDADMFARAMATFGPVLAAVQLGQSVGHLARTTMGPYELPIPRPAPRLLVVPANVERFAEAWSLPPDEVRLWVCVREQTLQAVLLRPAVSARVRDLLVAVVQGAAAEAGDALERFQGAFDPTDPGSVQRLFDEDPASLFGAAPSPARARAVADLAAVTAAILGYVEHVLDQAADRLLGGRRAIREAWRRRQVGRQPTDRLVEEMLGVDLGPAQIDRGSQFVHGVVERAGEEGLARLWTGAHGLPTPAELDAPGLWLERIDLHGPTG